MIYHYFVNLFIIFLDDIKSIKSQQKINLILSSIVLFLIIGIYSVKLIRWGRHHDCLSYFKIFKKKSSHQKPSGDFTHQNPHTQSPKMLNRSNPKVNNVNERASTVFSVTGTGQYIYCNFIIIIKLELFDISNNSKTTMYNFSLLTLLQ